MMSGYLRIGKTKKGQSLIEVLITVGIGVVIISSLVSLANFSTRRATGSRQANEASKLSQEGQEIMRHIRDAAIPGAVRISGCNPCSWNDLYNHVLGDSSVPYKLAFGTAEGCVPFEWCLVDSNMSENGLLDGVFRREVYIKDNLLDDGSICGDSDPSNPKGTSDIKRIHVRVYWGSSIGATGEQYRETVSCLAPNR